MRAEELGDLITEKRLVATKRAYEALRSKCLDAVNKMVIDLEYETVVKLSEEDILALSMVTEELRDLNYKFRFIEIQNQANEVIEHKLAISIAHIK